MQLAFCRDVFISPYMMAQVSARPSGAGRRSCRLLLARMVAAMILMLCLPASTAAADARTTTTALQDKLPGGAEHGNPCTTTAHSVAHTAQNICGGAPVKEALLAVRLRPAAADEAARLLAAMGFAAAVELEMLAADTPEMDELMHELKSAGLSVGDRSKVRLLVGDRRRFGQLAAHAPGDAGEMMHAARDHHFGDDANPVFPPSQRRLQTSGATGMSMDTIAIVFTVLIGATGYAVQVRSIHHLLQRERNTADGKVKSQLCWHTHVD